MGVDVLDGAELRKGAWSPHAATISSDDTEYSVELAESEERRVCFLSESAALCRIVSLGDRYEFTITHNSMEYPTTLVGAPPKAVFDDLYQTRYRGTTRVAIPEVYELVNVAIALTDVARQSKGLVATETPYYKEVMDAFEVFKEHKLVTALNREIKANQMRYFELKMDAYSFAFAGDSQIARSEVFDRIGDSPANSLLPYLGDMVDFARSSDFRAFFDQHRALYESQESFVKDGLNPEGMIAWLQREFPSTHPYESYNIIFSPLVGWNQSVQWFESNGFRELQAHVNYPHTAQKTGESMRTYRLRQGKILFTELNHGFINPTSDRYIQDISRAIAEISLWSVPDTPSRLYASRLRLFNEMMNWGLVAVYFVDKSHQSELEGLMDALDSLMGAENRGFRYFPEFRRFLVDLRQRASDRVLESLYPEIIEWFERKDQFLRGQRS